MKDFYKVGFRGMFFLIFFLIAIGSVSYAQYNYQVVQIDASQVSWGEKTGALPLKQSEDLTIHEILLFQLSLLNMVPEILYSDVGMLLFYYTSAIPLYLTVGAERLGGGFTFVAQNLYIAAAASIITVVAIRFSLAQLGITPGNQWPLSELLRIYFHFSPIPVPFVPEDYYQYDLAVNQAEDDASNEYGDPTSNDEPVITEEIPLPNADSPISVQHHYGCDVPNIDLDNGNNGSSPTYAGDKNACGPAAASNSLKWLEKISENITIPFSHRDLLDSLSKYMGRENGKGVQIEQFIKGKLDLIKALNLPIHVKFQAQGVDSNITSSDGSTFARNDKTGDYPTWEFLKQEMADSEDVEIFYKWRDGENWRGHVVVASGVYETENGKKYLGIKHDLTQARSDSNKTVQEFLEVTTDSHGRMVLHRQGVPRYIAHVVSESPGEPYSTPTGVEESSNIPGEFYLAQNYPNPFNPTTNFEFRIADFGFVSLKVYDFLGREVADLVNDVREPGYYKISFDASNLSSGTYFYKLTSNGHSLFKKMILLK